VRYLGHDYQAFKPGCILVGVYFPRCQRVVDIRGYSPSLCVSATLVCSVVREVGSCFFSCEGLL
jgi:hypothetical protein